MGRAGDVCSTINDGQICASVGVQRTRTQYYLNHSWCPGSQVVEPYVHYRLVLKTVGMSLIGLSTRNCIYGFTGHCNMVRDLYCIGLEPTLVQYGLQARYPLYQTVKIQPYDW